MAAGVKPDQVPEELKAIYAEVKDKGPGGHILTGPIFVEGAEAGDTLEVRIVKIKLGAPYAYNSFSPGRGVLAGDDFATGAMKIIPFDMERNVEVRPKYRNPAAAVLRQHGSGAAGSRGANQQRAARDPRRESG